MAKPSRKIFQPTSVTDYLIREYVSKTNGSMNDLINASIQQHFTPVNKLLKQEIDPLLYRLESEDEKNISPDELKLILANCVTILKDFPISDCRILDQIAMIFRTGKGFVYRYNYPLIVDDFTDSQLHHLDEILKSVDRNYDMGTHEIGERTKCIFKNWKDLCQYPEIYTMIGTIIRLEDIYMNLNPYITIDLVRQLDQAIQNYSVSPITTEFPVHISTWDRIIAVRYEILIYLCDNGYASLSGDRYFDHMPDYYRDFLNNDVRNGIKDNYIVEAMNDQQRMDYYHQLVVLESKGRKLLKSIAYESKRFSEKKC